MITTFSKPHKEIFHIHAYIDLYLTKKEGYNASLNASVYSVEFSNTHRSLISFTTKAKIDGEFYPTVDNIRDHLVYFYGNQYMRDVIPKVF